jgi:hypothetical protein
MESEGIGDIVRHLSESARWSNSAVAHRNQATILKCVLANPCSYPILIGYYRQYLQNRFLKAVLKVSMGIYGTLLCVTLVYVFN